MPRKLISLTTALLFLLQSTLALAVPYRYVETRVFSNCDCEFERNLVAGVSIAAGRNLELSSLQTRRMDKGVAAAMSTAGATWWIWLVELPDHVTGCRYSDTSNFGSIWFGIHSIYYKRKTR